jgi:branched-chain amino acid transport system ATP-binding protein
MPENQASSQLLLTVSGLRKYFGGVKALDGVDFEVRAGQCVALIGPNGAGKSTCFAALCGQHKPDAGQVRWLGDKASQSITGWSPEALCRLGIGRTFQVAQVFEAHTVLANVQLAMTISRRHLGFFPLKSQNPAAAQALLDQVGLHGQGAAQANALPYGAKKRLELAIALASSPQLLLLDEPAAGLAAPERRALMALVKQLCTGDMAVLYTEHNMDAVFGVADHVLVLVDGRIAAAGSPQAIAQNDTVKSRYLGQHFQAPTSPVQCVGTNTTPQNESQHA